MTQQTLLDSISSPADLRRLDVHQLPQLAQELRAFMVESVSKTGGHLSSSLGATELAIAIHTAFNTPEDRVIWDVGHQAYAHKILTGRREGMATLRKHHGLSGFPKRTESPYDAFGTAHSSTSISAALGMAIAARLEDKTDRWHIAVIGDGALTGGMALEALNDAGVWKEGVRLLVILNDNDCSISPPAGALSNHLAKIVSTRAYTCAREISKRVLKPVPGLWDIAKRMEKQAINFVSPPSGIFSSFDLNYYGPVDGHDVVGLVEVLKNLRRLNCPCVLHVATQKGKGYAPAEQHKEAWHYCAPFHPETGEPLMDMSGECYESITLDFMMKKMQADPSVCMITSGTPTVLGFTEEMRKKAGRQFIDVGIAEENAVALASGIAANGGKPVYGVYSTFIQRAYDQISQDLCINSNAATIIVAWGSVYGMNDVTHLGLYDIPMLANIPNLVYLAPTTKEEYLAMLDWSIEQNEHPVAIRMPGGALVSDGKAVTKDFGRLNTYEVKEKGAKVAVIGLGSFYPLGEQAAALIKEKTGVQPTLINPYYITGVDTDLLESLKADHDVVITLEDGVLDGGFGEKIARFYGDSDMKVLNFGLKKEFLDRYDVDEVLKDNHLTAEQIAEDVEKVL